MRKPYQGVWNIVRFNWHFYLIAFGLIMLCLSVNHHLDRSLILITHIICLTTLTVIFISLAVSFYVYDISPLYSFDWLNKQNLRGGNWVNIHAGFDETSGLLKSKFPEIDLVVFDFYDPDVHTEVSIKRARRAYPAHKGAKKINTQNIPLDNQSVDYVFLILSAHEIRNMEERRVFFTESNRILRPKGKIIVVEHLRDWKNFFAYNIGFLHFYSAKTWLDTFRLAELKIAKEQKITPFISVFILEKNGITP